MSRAHRLARSSTAPPAGSLNETDGYAITLPEGWLRIDMNAQDMAAVMQSAAGLSDDMATMMESQAATMALSGVDFWAIKTGDVGAGFASNANIIKQPSLNVSLDLIEQLSVNQLESLDMLGGRKVGHDRVQLPSGEALHLRYEVGAKDAADADITATIVQYLLARDDGQYILTVTGADGDATASAAESMAESWSFPELIRAEFRRARRSRSRASGRRPGSPRRTTPAHRGSDPSASGKHTIRSSPIAAIPAT